MYSDTSGLISRFGLDPREFYFLAFGGAGPMMGCFLARELKLKGVVVPPTPGVLSALGGLVADVKNDFIRTVYCDLMAAAEDLKDSSQDLRTEAKGWLAREYGADLPYQLSFSADMRYRGQSFEIDVALQESWLLAGDLAAVRAAFDAHHTRLFGHHDELAAVQLINLRLVLSSPTPKPRLITLAQASGPVTVLSEVDAWIDGQWWQVGVVSRGSLLAGHQLSGPVIIAQDDCTTCVPPQMQVDVDRFGNLIITPQTGAHHGN